MHPPPELKTSFAAVFDGARTEPLRQIAQFLQTANPLRMARAFGTCIALLSMAGILWPASNDYRAQIEQWRRDRQAALTADGGWLTVTGLFWLHEGVNPFGVAKTDEILLPPGPGVRDGAFEVHHGKITLRLDGKTREVRSDAAGTPDPITMGALTMLVIERGGKYAVRLKDDHSSLRKGFTALRYFPISEDYRIRTRLQPDAKKIAILNVLGQLEDMHSPGFIDFEIHGRKLRLTPVEESANELFFIFRDLTAGKETYASGRFLDAELGKDGEVLLDFNKAYNPPCAFTPYATCPLPPKENRLPVRIESGELKYAAH